MQRERVLGHVCPKHHSEKQHGECHDQIRVMVHENNSGCCSLSELAVGVSQPNFKAISTS
jgi:hypothetical protein